MVCKSSFDPCGKNTLITHKISISEEAEVIGRIYIVEEMMGVLGHEAILGRGQPGLR